MIQCNTVCEIERATERDRQADRHTNALVNERDIFHIYSGFQTKLFPIFVTFVTLTDYELIV